MGIFMGPGWKFDTDDIQYTGVYTYMYVLCTVYNKHKTKIKDKRYPGVKVKE